MQPTAATRDEIFISCRREGAGEPTLHLRCLLQPYFEDAVRLLEQVGSSRIRILMVIYHTQLQVGNVIELIRNHNDWIGYVHVADVPGRHEPGTGELDYGRISQELRNVGFNGWFPRFINTGPLVTNMSPPRS